MWQLRSIATWGRPTSRQCTLFTKRVMHDRDKFKQNRTSTIGGWDISHHELKHFECSMKQKYEEKVHINLIVLRRCVHVLHEVCVAQRRYVIWFCVELESGAKRREGGGEGGGNDQMIDSSLIEPDSSRQRYNRWRKHHVTSASAAGTDVANAADGDVVGSCNLRANRKLSARQDKCWGHLCPPASRRASPILGRQHDAAGTGSDAPVCRYGDQPDENKAKIGVSAVT